MNENKKGVLAKKRKVASIEPSKPRNFVAKNAINTGAGAHKDKKKAMKQGDTKHKKLDYAENLELQLNQKLQENKLDEFLPALGMIAGRALAGAEAGALTRGAAGLAGREIGKALEPDDTDEDVDSPEYNDEAGMSYGSLHTIARAVDGLLDTIKEGDNLPEWCQEKISLAEDYLITVWDYLQSEKEQGVAEGTGQQLSVQQLAQISDAALDSAYGYGRSSPGNTFGWQANLKSAAFAKQMIDKGVTDIEAISDAIHKGWNVTAQAFVKNPDQFDDSKTMAPEKLQAKIAQRQKLMTQQYAQLPEDEKEKDRVVARAMLQAIGGQKGVAEGGYSDYDDNRTRGFAKRGREDDEYHVPDPVAPEYNIKVNGEVINRQPFANRAEALAWAKQAVAAGKLDPKTAKLSPIQGMAEGLHPVVIDDVKKLATLNPVDRYSAYANIRGYFKDSPELSKLASALMSGYYEADMLRGKYKTAAAKAKYDELETMHRAFIKQALGQEQGVAEGWSQKYKSSINCSHPKGFSQKAHCAGKKKHNEDMSMEAVCPDCGMCEAHGNSKIYDKCWTGYKKVPGKKRGEEGSCKKIGESVAEKLNLKTMDTGAVIKDFEKSNAPQFRGKTKEKRKQMAIAAKMGAMKKKKKIGESLEEWTTDSLASHLFEQELTYEDRLNNMLSKKLSK